MTQALYAHMNKIKIEKKSGLAKILLAADVCG
jgi:hypothetical protein